jgi:hypothetical protein
MILMGAGAAWLLVRMHGQTMAGLTTPGMPAPSLPWFAFAMPVMMILLGTLFAVDSVPAITPPLARSVESPRLSAHARARLRGMLSPRAYRRLNFTLLRTASGPYPAIAIALFAVLLLLAADRGDPSPVPTDIGIAATFVLQLLLILTGLAMARRLSVAADPFLRRRFPGHCPRCAHPAGTRNITACPECGQAMGGPRPERPPRRRRRRRPRPRQSASIGRSSVTESRPS